MSICGKYDFEDYCSGIPPDEFIKTHEVYSSWRDLIPLKLTEPKDLIAYYTYPVAMAVNSDGKSKCYLGEESYLDQWEKERLQFALDDVKKYFRSCKRKKVGFDEEHALEMVSYFGIRDSRREIVKRVKEQGDKATIDGIYDEWIDTIRERWHETMVDAGWDPDLAYRWIYGFSRWCKKLKETMGVEKE